MYDWRLATSTPLSEGIFLVVGNVVGFGNRRGGHRLFVLEMVISFSFATFLVAACVPSDQASTPLAEPSSDQFVDDLRRQPEVANVEVIGNGDKTLIHVGDWHDVPLKLFQAELPPEVSQPELNELYTEFLKSVDAVQQQQTAVLSSLETEIVWQEGLTDEGVEGYRGLVDAIRDAGPMKDEWASWPCRKRSR